MEQIGIVLCDTDVIIEFYRGNHEIISELKIIGQHNIAISYITAGELIYGTLNKRELAKIKRDIDHLLLYEIDSKICNSFLDLLSKYSLSHKLAIPDCFIAATAITQNIPLFTLNKKDYKFIEGLILY
jgi:tRNA(fMet)-specific endonuclease VapC